MIETVSVWRDETERVGRVGQRRRARRLCAEGQATRQRGRDERADGREHAPARSGSSVTLLVVPFAARANSVAVRTAHRLALQAAGICLDAPFVAGVRRIQPDIGRCAQRRRQRDSVDVLTLLAGQLLIARRRIVVLDQAAQRIVLKGMQIVARIADSSSAGRQPCSRVERFRWRDS